MERFLITLSLGPVQSLIGAARRTRDLWCGSWLLSEAARAAARVLHQEHPNCLIFPCPANPDADLAPQDRPGDAANISNILRAEVEMPNAADARTLCNKAKAAAVLRLKVLGDVAQGGMADMGRPVRGEVWQAQIDEILDCFAAWVSVTANEGDYMKASRKLGGVLAARKGTRDFSACRPLSVGGLPKSSLDGALETVLRKWPRGDRARHKLGLSDREQLDALGVMKRLAGESEQFTAYSRIAADPWIEELTVDQQSQLREAYEPLVDHEVATRVRGNAGIYNSLPFDAQMLYTSRLNKAKQQADDRGKQALNNLQRCLRKIARERTRSGNIVGDPVPYAVILKADGDRMGEFLSRADGADKSRAISHALHDFASKVRKIVRHHRGHAIYAGGDDVLALVPLAQALKCSRALADTFRSSLGEVAVTMEVSEDERPTLSVGLGIGHFMQPLGALRDRAERAEKIAKGNDVPNSRNALAIVLGIRSGAEHCWRAQWNDKAALEALEQMTDAYRKDQLPSRAAYDLRGIDLRLAWLREDQGDRPAGMRTAELRRTLDRARLKDGGHGISSELRNLIEERAAKQPLGDLADTLIISRWLSARSRTDVGERE